MSSYQYERLSGQDNDFLLWETPELPMHVASTNIFDAGPLRNAWGGIDFEAIKRLTESVLHLIPRYRQKIAWIPGEKHAVWVDDDHFNLDYHFRHTSLPRPGTDAQLKTLTARLMEHSLDRAHPLWETWVVEGLEGDRFATVNKIHHCMVDGASGMNLSELLLSRTAEREVHPAPGFIPRPVPSPEELRSDERIRKLTLPLRLGRDVFGFVQETPDVVGELTRRAEQLAGLAQRKLFPVSPTPINGTIGPHRVVDWCEMPFADVRALRRKLGCKVNDVVLTAVTGAIRGLMQRRQVNPVRLDFRVSTPVNVRRERGSQETGNYVSSWVVRLPLALEEPLDQLEAIRRTTSALRETDEAGAVKFVIGMLDALGLSVQDLSVGTMNTIVTNVPGPPFPLYMLGAELRQMVPIAPLIENLGLSIGVLTYNGRLLWGFNADADRIPDLADFRRAVQDAFARLAAAAGVRLGETPLLEARSAREVDLPAGESPAARVSGPARQESAPARGGPGTS